jgi:hypothetical protein
MTHSLDGVNEQTAKLGWGSDIASLRSGCGSGWQVLATSTENNAADSVRAFETNDREPMPATQAVSLDGGISALWTAADGGSAIAVSRNREVGTYEAFRLTINCDR